MGSNNMAAADNTPVVVKKLQMVAAWQYADIGEYCGICKEPNAELCIDCLAEGKEGPCEMAVGECNHAFHWHCISGWLQRKSTCPLDQQDWQLAYRADAR